MPIPISYILYRDQNDIILFGNTIYDFITEYNILIFEKFKTSFVIFDKFIDAYDLKKIKNEENLQLAKEKNFAIKFTTTYGNKLILLCFTKIDDKAFVNICCYCEKDNIKNIGNLKKYLLNIFVS